ncbi:MAG: hypothetical protein K9G70_12980 [Prolixibacteraceae bacterium]|nr:hypothetical protein [Prolixibacteraceae bacterium]
MKSIGNFLVGSLTSLGVSVSLPGSAEVAETASSNVVDSVEALVSIVSGLLSAMLVAWFKRKWGKKDLKKS